MQANLIGRFIKNKKAILVLASTFAGLILFTTSVGISLTIKYNGSHPRAKVNEFAQKISFVSFKPEQISKNSNFWKIKEKLFSGDQLKKEINLEEYLQFYIFDKNSNDLVKFSKDSNPFSIEFEFSDLKFDDLNQNFNLKFRVRQKQKNNQYAYSDFFSQPITFYESNKFLKADFNFVLQKMFRQINENILNIGNFTTNFSDQTSKKKLKKLYRAIDFAQEVNKIENPNEVEVKINEILPELSNLILRARESKDNKIGKTENPIFSLKFIKNKTNNQFVNLQDNIPTMYLEAKLTEQAAKMLGDIGQNFSEKIFEIRFETKDKKSLFFNVENFFQNIKLKPLKFNTEEKDGKLIITELNPFDIFSKIKSGILSANTNQNYIKGVINSLLEEDLALDFGPTSKLIPQNQNGISFEIIQQNAKLKNENDNYIIEIPYKIFLRESLFKPGSQKIIYEKELFLSIGGFGISNKNGQNLIIPGSQKALIYRKNSLFNDEESPENKFISTFGQPVISNNPLKKEEIDNLLLQQDYKGLERQLNSLSRYNFNFDNFEAKVRAWSGKTYLPSLTEIANFRLNQQKIDINSQNQEQKIELKTLHSQSFFINPSDVTAFFADLIQKKPSQIANSFFLIAKAFGLLNQNRTASQIFNNLDGENIFETSSKIHFDNKTTNILSFNNHFADFYNQGFFSSLFLPKSIKDKFNNLKSKSISDVISILKDQELFKETARKFTRQQIEENLKSSVKFTTLAHLLLAFYYKASQLDNFLGWTKLDTNLDYEIVFQKENEISKVRYDSEIQKLKKPELNSLEKQENLNKNSEIQPESKNLDSDNNIKKSINGNLEEDNTYNANVDNEYLTLNFYYIIGDSSQKKFFFQSPIQKILINFSTQKIDENSKIQEKFDKVVESVPADLLNYSVSEENFKKIKEKLTNKHSPEPKNNDNNNDLDLYFKETSINIDKISSYFKEQFPKVETKFLLEPSFENSLNTDKLTFLISFYLNKKDKNPKDLKADNKNDENSQINPIIARQKLKIIITKNSKNK